MTEQVPRGPDNLYCPQWKKPMSKVCHTCPWWVKVTMVDPNAKNDLAPALLDKWNCAIAWGPTLAVNAGKETFRVAAQVQEMRNEAAQNNAQQAGNMEKLNQNLITMHTQTAQVALAQIRSNQKIADQLSPPSSGPKLLEHTDG
jgi:hypothetical protein